MKINQIDTDQQVFIVAEIGNNHEGHFAIAQELIQQAAQAGADAVKFQTFLPELFYLTWFLLPRRFSQPNDTGLFPIFPVGISGIFNKNPLLIKYPPCFGKI